MTDLPDRDAQIEAILARTADDHLRTAATITADGHLFGGDLLARQTRIQTELLWSIAKRHDDA